MFKNSDSGSLQAIDLHHVEEYYYDSNANFQ